MDAPWDEPGGAYAGIGSRKTPDAVLAQMEVIARVLGARGWVLRSGGAPGADAAFLRGGLRAGEDLRSGGAGEVVIFKPWPAFGGLQSSRPGLRILGRPTPDAYIVAAAHHPSWNSLSESARVLHARNSHQVLGRDLVSPSRFVVCWTPDGAVTSTGPRTGGTGQAIRVALAHGVPVFNLKRAEHAELLARVVPDL